LTSNATGHDDDGRNDDDDHDDDDDDDDHDDDHDDDQSMAETHTGISWNGPMNDLS
jgi:hypothetical protein